MERKFYEKYLQKEGIFNYLEELLCNVRNTMGNYCIASDTKKMVSKSLYELSSKSLYELPDVINKNTYGFQNAIYILFTKYDTRDYVILDKQIKNTLNVCVNKLFFLNDYPVIEKSLINTFKQDELIHEYNIGTSIVNKMRKRIPNFMCTYAIFDNKLYTEYIPGVTLFDYIRGHSFQLTEFFNIMTQLLLSIDFAYHTHDFVHNDLQMWNIILTHDNSVGKICYREYSHSSNFIPIIIDYGKSKISSEINDHNRDIYTLIITSAHLILKHQTIDKYHLSIIFELIHMCGITCNNVRELRSKIQVYKKYNNILKRIPPDLNIYEIISIMKKTNSIKKIAYYPVNIYKTNTKSVVKYTLSNNITTRLKAFTSCIEKGYKRNYKHVLSRFIWIYTKNHLNKCIGDDIYKIFAQRITYHQYTTTYDKNNLISYKNLSKKNRAFLKNFLHQIEDNKLRKFYIRNLE